MEAALRDQPDRPSAILDWLRRWILDLSDEGAVWDNETAKFSREVLPHFSQAVPFIWTGSMYDIMSEAIATMPKGGPLPVKLEMPFDNMLFAWKYKITLWDMGIDANEKDCLDGQTPEEAAKNMEPFWELIYRRSETEATTIMFGRDNSGRRDEKAPEGKELVWYKAADWNCQDEAGRMHRAFFRWLDSPYVVYAYPGTGNENRAERRRVQRLQEQVPPMHTEPKFIMLRRSLTKKGADYKGMDVNWTHQWLVSGHWRDQWHPSTRSHKLTWIAPYVKGPPDLPLKTPVRLITR